MDKIQPKSLHRLLFLVCLFYTSYASAQYVTIFEEDWETNSYNTNNWTGSLESKRWSLTSTNARDNYVMKFKSSGNRTGNLYSKAFDLTGYNHVNVTFWMRSKTVTDSDDSNNSRVYVSNDNGATWVQVINDFIKIDEYNEFGFVIDDYVSLTNQVKIRFWSKSQGNGSGTGKDTYVDDIVIRGVPTTASVNVSEVGIAQFWAPEVFQAVRRDQSFGHQFHEGHDLLLKIDYDNNWYAGDQKENSKEQASDLASHIAATGYDFEAGAYYRFFETSTHYFIAYNYYHSMDDAIITADQHENDFEGVVVCVEKVMGKPFGKFVAMVTASHGNWQEYDYDILNFYNGAHPGIFIASNGGAAESFLDGCGTLGYGHAISRFNAKNCMINRGIRYTVSDVGSYPTSIDDEEFEVHNQYTYTLNPMDEIWNRRSLYSTLEDYPVESYNKWGDEDEEPTGGGPGWKNEWYWDPAGEFTANFSSLSLSSTYTHNPYWRTGSDNENDEAGITSLNSSWSAANLGTPTKSGYSWSANGTFTINGGGSDIWGTSDEGYFVYQTLSGDGEIVAKVQNIQDNIHAWTKAGLMIRETLDANSKFADIVGTPDNGVSFQRRTSTGGSSSGNTTSTIEAPVWLKLVRSGNAFSGYYSTDGSSWTQVGSTTTVSMTTNVYIGMAVTSHDVSYLASTTFDQVTVTGSSSARFASNQEANTVLSVDEVSELMVYPNPARDYLEVSLPQGGIYTLSLMTLSGRTLRQKANVINGGRLNLQGLSEGIYVLKIRGKETTYSRQILIK